MLRNFPEMALSATLQEAARAAGVAPTAKVRLPEPAPGLCLDAVEPVEWARVQGLPALLKGHAVAKATLTMTWGVESRPLFGGLTDGQRVGHLYVRRDQRREWVRVDCAPAVVAERRKVAVELPESTVAGAQELSFGCSIDADGEVSVKIAKASIVLSAASPSAALPPFDSQVDTALAATGEPALSTELPERPKGAAAAAEDTWSGGPEAVPNYTAALIKVLPTMLHKGIISDALKALNRNTKRRAGINALAVLPNASGAMDASGAAETASETVAPSPLVSLDGAREKAETAAVASTLSAPLDGAREKAEKAEKAEAEARAELSRSIEAVRVFLYGRLVEVAAVTAALERNGTRRVRRLSPSSLHS